MPSPSRRNLLAVSAALIGAAMLPARAAAPVKVSSKLDTEGALLGNMILALLKQGNVPTENRLRLGTTKIMRSALVAGEIDLYPEYTGNGAFFFSQDSDPVWKNPQAGYERIKQLDMDANKLVWLPPAPANNTWGVAVTTQVAEAQKLRTMEDFAHWVGSGATVKLAASAEFVASPAALPSFQSAYGFSLGSNQLLVLAGGDTAATERAAAEGTSGVNAAMAYGTDGGIAALELVLLADTKHAQMVYEPAAVVRQAALDAYPAIPGLLAPAFAALDGDSLRTLNAKIAVDGEDPAAVAATWLKDKGLIK